MRKNNLERVLKRYVRKTTSCWIWIGYTFNGYGCVMVGGKRRYAHRYIFEQIVGKVPEGLVLHHTCRNRSCVNPVHLEVMDKSKHGEYHARSL